MMDTFCIRFHSPQSTYCFSCSESDNMSGELDDSTFCPICFEFYSESGDTIPRLLPCAHTMCHACMAKLIKNNTLVCPQDRKPHPALNGVHSFPQTNVGDKSKKNLKSEASLLIKQLNLYKSRLINTSHMVFFGKFDLSQKLKQRRNALEKEFHERINAINENIRKLNEICKDTTGDLQKGKEIIEMLQKKTKENQETKYRFYDLVEISRDIEPPGETDRYYFEQEQPNFEGNFTKMAFY